MPKYEYLGPGLHYMKGGDETLEPGEMYDLPESTVEGHESRFNRVEEESASLSDFTGEEDESPSADEEMESEGSEPAQNGSEGESSDLPLDPSEFTIPELKAELDGRDLNDEELDEVEKAEAADDPRAGALDAIQKAR